MLIPTRARVRKLVRCLDSIKETCDNPDNVEIILRMDEDDTPSVEMAQELRDKYGAIVIVGLRGDGWAHNHKMFDEMISIQRGAWCSFFNDDATIEGDGWDEQLGEVPYHGFLVHPEFMGIGGSVHQFLGGGNFPTAPKGCWEEYGWKGIQHPVDTGLDRLLVHQHGWKNHFLRGVSFLHDRDEVDIMTQRKL